MYIYIYNILYIIYIGFLIFKFLAIWHCARWSQFSPSQESARKYIQDGEGKDIALGVFPCNWASSVPRQANFFHQDGIHHIASCVGIADDLTEPSNRCEIQDIIDKSRSAGGEVRVFFQARLIGCLRNCYKSCHRMLYSNHT